METQNDDENKADNPEESSEISGSANQSDDANKPDNTEEHHAEKFFGAGYMIDNSQLDVFLVSNEQSMLLYRPYLVAYIDKNTRTIIGCVIKYKGWE